MVRLEEVFSSFEDMPVWQKAMELAQKVFSLTEGSAEERKITG